MTTNKPIMDLKVRHIYGKSEILPDSVLAQCLFDLLQRGTIQFNELPLIAKLGFEVNVRGDIQPLSAHLMEDKIHHKKFMSEGKITI